MVIVLYTVYQGRREVRRIASVLDGGRMWSGKGLQRQFDGKSKRGGSGDDPRKASERSWVDWHICSF